MSRAEHFPMHENAPQSIEAAQDWVGRTETRDGALTPDLAGMLQAAVSHAAAAPRDLATGADMPALWHWAAFPEFVPLDELGPDGHPAPGGFLPPLPYARRMWASGALRFEGALGIGEPLRRHSEILSVTGKTGGTGSMAFVTVRHITEGQGGRVEETQDIVYLDIPPEFRAPKRVPAPDAPLFDEAVPVNEARLFRFSAATFNAHRIHYDLPYAREVEKYPGLVVHGPMQAMMLMEAAERHSGRRAARFRFRGLHPMFHDHGLRLVGVPDDAGGGIDLGTAAPEGYLGQKARMEWDG